MPVILNRSTRLAENVPLEKAQELLSSPEYEVPMVNEQGEIIGSPYKEAQSLLGQGYREPNDEELKNLVDYAKFSSPSEQLKTGLEGAASAATFGLSTGVETALGANPEDIQAREEINPGMRTAGELVGLAASSLLPGEGALGVLEKAGEAASAGVASSVAKQSIKGAVETALFAGGNEVSKLLESNPHQSAETAMVNIGLNGLLGGAIGGAFGVAPKLWEAAHGPKLTAKLKEFKDHATGVSKKEFPIDEAVDTLGIEVPEIIRAAASDDKTAQRLYKKLNESFTRAGNKAQAVREDFRNTLNKSALDALETNPEQIESILKSSDNATSRGLIDALKGDIRKIIQPLGEQFEKYKKAYEKIELKPLDQEEIYKTLGKYVTDSGIHLLEKSNEKSFINNVLSSLKNLQSLGDLRNLRIRVGKEAFSSNLPFDVKKNVVGILQEYEDDMVSRVLGSLKKDLGGVSPSKKGLSNPDQISLGDAVVENHERLRADYRKARLMLEGLDQRIKVGHYEGPETFLHALSEKIPEKVLKSLTPTNDGDLLKLVSGQLEGLEGLVLPQTEAILKKAYLEDLITSSGQKGNHHEPLKLHSLFSILGKSWSPELKAFALPAGAEAKIDAIKTIIQRLPGMMNPSHTAGTADYLGAGMLPGAGLAVGLLTGHMSFGLMVGALARVFSREAPDAAQYAFLKHLGSDAGASATGFKAAFEYFDAVSKGSQVLNKAVKSLFEAGKSALPSQALDSEKLDEKLKKKLEEYRVDPAPLLNVGGETGHYLPDQAGAMAQLSARAVSYLQSIKPDMDKKSPFDSEKKPSAQAQAEYHRAIHIANQPLAVLEYVQAGTITSKDVQTFKAIYPGLYTELSQKMIGEMINLTSKGNAIPYQKRLSVSRFLGQPLDSTMTPQAILSAQPKTPQMSGQEQGLKPPSASSTKSLNKLPNMFMSPTSSRELHRLNK